MENKLGILGGMGPKATSIFFNNVIDKTVAESDNEHIEIIILNDTKIPDRTEAIKSGNYTDILNRILLDIKQLELLNVKNIAIPCNTSCFFLDMIKQKTNIHIINMVDETSKYISEINKKQNAIIGILATNGTIQSKIYHRALEKYNLKCIEPSNHLQERIMEIIYNQVKKNGSGNIEEFNYIIKEMKKLGCDYLIIGCTELSYFSNNYDLPNYCIDALEVLTKISIELSGKEYKNNS